MLPNYHKCVVVLLLLSASCVWAVEKPTTITKTCVTDECHNLYTQKEYVHGPVALGVCKYCHKPVDKTKHTFKLLREGGELCSHCHLEQAVGKYLHKPLETGRCTGCHDPHSSDYKFLIPVPKVSDLCRKCHETAKDKKHMHGPVAAGECTLCHNSHSSDYENLLIDNPKELCFFCHEIMKKELSKFEFIHKPVTEKGCMQCHDPHGTNNTSILKDAVPELCLSCHKDVKLVAQKAKRKHSVVTQRDGCTKCHTPHASTVRFSLKADPMTLCVSCHNKEIEDDEGGTIANLKAQVENRKYLHGPVGQKDCKACHISHGSDHFRLLISEYPSSFYAPFDIKIYQLCFNCHPANLVLNKETTDLTDFRNGSLNLHYLHVNKPEKGRTCRACHATHASNHPKHVREAVPFGKWEIPIQFEKTSTGGSCSPGCHKPKAYDRNIPVTYETPVEENDKATESQNDIGDSSDAEK